MSLVFYVPGAASAGCVQMCNGTGRIVLALLGEDTEHLEGWLPLRLFEQKLAAITPELVTANARPPRLVSEGVYDHGSPAERLTLHVAGLRKLAAAARDRQAEGARIAWG